VTAAGLGALIRPGTDLLGGFRLDQCLQDQRERVADDIQIATGAQCI
jgi:hypothetical protein